MSTKAKLYLLFLFVFFSACWWVENIQFLPEIERAGIRILDDMASSYSGYNDIYLHGSVYSLFFVLLINMILPDIHPQVLLRMDRKPYIRRLYAWNIVAAGLFTIMFLGIAAANTTIVVGASKLWAWGYYKAAVLSLILTFLYYVLTGTVFLFLYILTGTKTKAMFVTYFISVVLVGLPFFIRLHWTPVTSLTVLDDMLENRFRYSSVILDMAKLTGLSAFLYLFTIYIFKGKDILAKNG